MTRTDTTGFYYQQDVSPHSYNGFYRHNRGVKVNPTLWNRDLKYGGSRPMQNMGTGATGAVEGCSVRCFKNTTI